MPNHKGDMWKFVQLTNFEKEFYVKSILVREKKLFLCSVTLIQREKLIAKKPYTCVCKKTNRHDVCKKVLGEGGVLHHFYKKKPYNKNWYRKNQHPKKSPSCLLKRNSYADERIHFHFWSYLKSFSWKSNCAGGFM